MPPGHLGWCVRENRRGFPSRFQSIRRSGPFCLLQNGKAPKGKRQAVPVSSFCTNAQKILFRPKGLPTPNRSPAKRVRFGEEEQRHERALTFKKSRSKRYRACSDVVEVGGVEPPSESTLTGLSPGADDYCGSLPPCSPSGRQTVTPSGQVSFMMCGAGKAYCAHIYR